MNEKKTDVFSLENGDIVFQRPSKISEDEMADVKEFMQLVLRSMERSAKKSQERQEPS